MTSAQGNFEAFLVTSFCILFCTGLSENSEEEFLERKYSKSVNNDEVIYKALFKQKRIDQLEAVKSVANAADFEKQYKMVHLLLKKIFEVLGKSKVVIESSNYVPGASFPTENNVKVALSHILENTAFFGDILLRLPDITHNLLTKNRDWLLLIQWCVGFSTTTDLYDKSSKELISLVSQELNLVDRDPHYFNPYRKVPKAAVQQPVPVSKEKKKKKVKLRGPQLSGQRHSEL